jgi:hypothetical protein
LNYLNCQNNDLSDIDISKNVELNLLRCGNNKLNNLDVSNNTNLEYLHCEHNELQELNVFQNVKLRRLYCQNNKLSELDISQSPNLYQTNCRYNELTKLNISIPGLGTEFDGLEIDCRNNKLRFSTLPPLIIGIIGGFYRYSPQDTIYGGTKEITDTVDLSSEYIVEHFHPYNSNNITEFEWFDITDGEEKEIEQPTNENGVFSFTEEHAGKILRCKMRNEQFPGLNLNSFTLVYEVEIEDTDNIEETPEIYFTVSPNPAQDKLTIHHSKEIGNIGLYDLSGRLLKSRDALQCVFTVLDISDLDIGVYFITVDGKSVKFIKEP